MASRALSRRRFLLTTGGVGGALLVPREILALYETYDEYPTVADSARDFSGVQGYDGWYYGHANAPYTVDAFEPMSQFVDDAWVADATRLTADGGHAGGRLAVRRWVSSIDDKVEIYGSVSLPSPAGESRLSIYADGRLLRTQDLNGDWPSSEFEIPLRLVAGMTIDFAVEGSDAFTFNAVVGLGGCSKCCFAEPASAWRQDQLPWGPLLYDHKTASQTDHRIADVGCALTCLAMSLRYAGYLTTPVTLNTDLKNGGGYVPKHKVWWSKGVEIAKANSGKAFKWNELTTSNAVDLEPIICGHQDPTPGVFNAGFPIIVGVKRPPDPATQAVKDHFILVVGFRRDSLSGDPTYFVIDPLLSGLRNLNQYGPFISRGYVTDPPDELSGLEVLVENASLSVTDPLGRTTSFDPATGETANVPQSVAFGDSLFGDVTNTPDDSFTSTVSIEGTAAGSYSIAVTGFTGGTHTLVIRAHSNDGIAQPELTVSIEAAAGQTVTLDLEYSDAPGSEPQLVKNVTVVLAHATINLNSNGVLPVTILSTPTFDATQIDPLSVRFGRGKAIEAHGRGHIEDGNLVLHFSAQESGIAEGDTEVCLTGMLFSGGSIRGCAAIDVH